MLSEERPQELKQPNASNKHMTSKQAIVIIYSSPGHELVLLMCLPIDDKLCINE